jgi:riboflavin synthase
MFTGIVEDTGRVERLEPLARGSGVAVTLAAALLEEEMPLGASLAVDGVCLTVTHWQKGRVKADVGPETMARTTLGGLAVGQTVNLERPLRLGDRLGGHLVSGHVDGVGTLAQVTPRGDALDLRVALAPELARYVVEKGSITIDGISLTVNQVDDRAFTVSLIPHTQLVTTLARKGVGARVNLETDLIGKYVERLLGPARPAGGLDLAKLKEHGYVD